MSAHVDARALFTVHDADAEKLELKGEVSLVGGRGGEPDAQPGREAVLPSMVGQRLLDHHGIVIAPGPYFGPGGEGHVRIALVPTPEDCRRAAERLASGA